MRVIVNSIPKSGTHLLAHLMDLIGLTRHKPDLNGALLRRYDRNPLIRIKKYLRRGKPDTVGSYWIDLDIGDNWVRGTWLEYFLDSIQDNSYIVGHLPYSKKLSDLFQSKHFYHLFIYRDPRDILVSYINYQIDHENLPFHKTFISSDQDNQVRHVLSGLESGRIVLAPLSERIQRAKDWISDDQTLAIRFEDLIGAHGSGSADKQLSTVHKVVDWCNISMSPDKVESLAKNVYSEESDTFNKGSIGQGRNFLDQDLQELFNVYCGKLMEELGYESNE